MPITVAAYTPSVAVGPHQAVCTGLEVKVSKDGSEFRVWEFTTEGGQTTSGSSSMSTSPKSKGGRWLAALLGRVPEAGEEVEPVGRPCTIIVELDDNGYERVTTVAPPQSAGRTRNVTPALEAEAIHARQEGPDHQPSAVDPTSELPF